jgi:hypothetical protein
MKLLLMIGPDILGIDGYKSKKYLRRYLDGVVVKGKIIREDSCDLKIFNRRYSSLEVRESEILTLNEFFEISKDLLKCD